MPHLSVLNDNRVKITCQDIGKRYAYSWIFRHLNCEFSSNQIYGVTGSNGSGKSTFLKILSGYLTPSEGQIHFEDKGTIVSIQEVYKIVAFSAPYIDIIEDLSVAELIVFHNRFKPLISIEKSLEIVKQLPFKGLASKKISDLSSGMLQRIKLILSIMSQSKILLLDEPGSNLDESGKIWWQNLLNEFKSDKIIIIASNEAHDLAMCKEFVNIESYNTKPSLFKA